MKMSLFEKRINEMKVGESFYFNAIAGTIQMGDFIRKSIKNGKIAPDRSELDKMIHPDYIDKFLSGESIAPQMTYIIIA